MTRVKLERKGNIFSGYRYSIEADGHAADVHEDGSVTGSREVCLAVSVILQLVQTWLDWTDSEREITLESGKGRISFSGDKCDTLFEVACCGIRRLAETNPDCIQYEFTSH